MEPTQVDFERVMMFEHLRMTAEANYASNPDDVDNLVKWGGSLLELSQFGDMNESKRMITESTSKLEQALKLNPARHDALWALGNAYTSHAFLSRNRDDAQTHFEKATESYKKALDENPGNELYLKSLEATAQAPELYMELQKHGFGQQALGGGASATSNAKGKVKKGNSDLKYDICGWIILAVGIVAWVGMAKSQVPPPPPR